MINTVDGVGESNAGETIEAEITKIQETITKQISNLKNQNGVRGSSRSLPTLRFFVLHK